MKKAGYITLKNGERLFVNDVSLWGKITGLPITFRSDKCQPEPTEKTTDRRGKR